MRRFASLDCGSPLPRHALQRRVTNNLRDAHHVNTLKFIPECENTLADTLSRVTFVDNAPDKAPLCEAINLLQNLQYVTLNCRDIR